MYLTWILFGFLMAVLYLFARMIYKYYIDPSEQYFVTKYSVIICLVLSMICLLIIPIDILVTQNNEKTFSTLEINVNQTFMKELELKIYGVLILCSFILLPFSYFYCEQKQKDFDEDVSMDTTSTSSKFFKALQNTTFFILVVSVLLLLGLVIKEKDRSVQSEGVDEVDWVKELFDVEHLGESAISFCIALFISFGSILWVIYGSYGLIMLPLYLIKGTKSLSQEKDEVFSDLDQVKQQQKSIQGKYAKSHGKISNHDKKNLANLRKRERILQFKTSRISELEENTNDNLQTLFKILAPFRILLGISSLIISFMLYYSLFLSTYDRIQGSSCGLRCGYITERKQTFNPLDQILVYLSSYYPLDYFCFFIIAGYMYIALLYGIIKLGFNYLWLKNYEIRRSTSQPQALIIFAFFVSICIMVMTSQIMYLSPQYTTFGAQRTVKGDQCTLSSVSSSIKYICSMSNISTFYNKMSLSFPLFAMVFFFSNVAFLFLKSIFFVYGIFKGRNSQIDDDDYLYNDEESTQLISYY
ncbi:hypothetical protein ABPG72_021998 [Tetrahymena utriculariae]